MSFIRGKTTHSKKYGAVTHYYLVENYREAGHVRQRVIAYLGDMPTLDEAIQQMTSWLAHNGDDPRREAKITRRLAALCSAQKCNQLFPNLGTTTGGEL